MEAYDRELMKLTANGVHALLREFTMRFAGPRSRVLADAQSAENKLRAHLLKVPPGCISTEELRQELTEAKAQIQSALDVIDFQKRELEALREELRKERKPTVAEQILEHLKQGPASVASLSIALGRTRGSLTSRLSALRRSGWVEHAPYNGSQMMVLWRLKMKEGANATQGI